MLFDTIDYWIFFGVVLALFYSLPFRISKVLLLGASYVFYMFWDARFVVLIVASTTIDFALGIALETANGARRKALLVISLVVNLGILGFFKYYNFFAANLAELLHVRPSSSALHIILPVGISFYTFASLSYTIDVYWRKIRAVRNFVDYALFVAFFPHLVAGPIIRARRFLIQVQAWHHPSAGKVQIGIALILSGLVKKMVFADQFAISSDNYFAHLGQHPGWLSAWTGAFAFLMQVFFDFSGYTDIARGCAKLFGFEFPLNFERPYLATDIAEFWQRWHISLTRWIRDYVFVPFTDQRRGEAIVSRNIIITLVLVGLWHGANWTFVLWGLYCGLSVAGYRQVKRWTRGTAVERVSSRPVFLPVKVMLTVISVTFGMALFRARSIGDSVTVIAHMLTFHAPPGPTVLTTTNLVLLVISVVLAVLQERYRFVEQLAEARARYQIPAYLCVFFGLELFAATGQQIPFIYFQF